MPEYGVGGGIGGSINSGYNSNSTYFNTSKWGENLRGYKTHQFSGAKGGGWGASVMWTYSRTWLIGK